MFETFGRGLSGKVMGHTLQQSWDMDSDFFYEGNAPIQEYMGLMVDLYGATDKISQKMMSYNSGPGGDILRLLDEVEIADKLADDSYLERIRDQDEYSGGGADLVRSIEAVRGLSKQQMLQMIPDACALVQLYMQTRGAFECLEELFAEVKKQNERLSNQMNRSSNEQSGWA